MKRRPALLRISSVVAVLVLWELVRRFNLVSPLLLASPSDIVSAAVHDGGKFLVAFELTLVEIAVAIAISLTFGILFGSVIGAVGFFSAVSAPILSSLFAVPLITWYPLFMVWFGIGSASKIAFGVVSGFFPIAINTMNGIRNIDRRYVVYGRAVGCSPAQIVFHILIPMAIPSIVAGLRIGTSLAIIGVVVAEMLASLGGIGYLITTARNYYQVGDVYLGISLALLCAIVANLSLSALEKRFAHWRELQAGQK
jgi:NitT/TauT family transport system permease protein/taurine transport system permease protein